MPSEKNHIIDYLPEIAVFLVEIVFALSLVYLLVQNFSGDELLKLYSALAPKISNSSHPEDMLSFAIAVASIAIPISLTTANQIVDRYKSVCLAKKFSQSLPVQLLPICTCGTIVLIITSRIFDSDSNPMLQGWLSLCATITFTISLPMLLFYLQSVLTILDSSKILDDAFRSLNVSKFPSTNFLKRTTIFENQSIIADVLAFETEQQHNGTVLRYLERSRDKALELLGVSSPLAFSDENLMVSDSFLNATKSAQGKAAFEFRFFPSKVYENFSVSISIFTRVINVGGKKNNRECALWAISRLASIARQLNGMEGTGTLLNIINREMITIIQSSGKPLDDIIAATIVNAFRDNTFTNAECLVDSVELNSEALFQMLQVLLKQNRMDALTDIIQYYLNAHYHGNYSSIWDYSQILFRRNFHIFSQLDDEQKIQSRFESLAHAKNYTNQELKKWLDMFQETQKICLPLSKGENDEELLHGAKEVIQDQISIYKFNRLRESFFRAGAFALYTARYEFLEHLLTAHSPKDSEAIWAGEDLIPNTLASLLDLYFSMDNYAREFSIVWDGHHGATPYFRMYLCFCMARLVEKDEFCVPLNSMLNGDIHKLEQEIPQLLSALETIKNSHQEEYGLRNAVKRETLIQRLPKALIELSFLCRAELAERSNTSKISVEIRSMFFDNFDAKFDEVAAIRKEFLRKKRFGEHRTAKLTTCEKFHETAYRTTYSKAFFLDPKLRDNLADIAQKHASRIAQAENSFVIQELEKLAINISTLREFLQNNRITNTSVLLAPSWAVPLLEDTNYTSDSNSSSYPLNIEFPPCRIPILEVLSKHLQDKLMVIDINKGWLMSQFDIENVSASAQRPDRKIIDLNTDLPLRTHLTKFGQSPEELRSAVALEFKLLISLVISKNAAVYSVNIDEKDFE